MKFLDKIKDLFSDEEEVIETKEVEVEESVDHKLPTFMRNKIEEEQKREEAKKERENATTRSNIDIISDREIVKTKKYTAKTNLKTYIWHNKNKLLQYDYITGGKTGYTEKAKRTLVSTASKNNLNLVVVTIKDSDDWNTHKSLYEYAFDNYKSYNILNKKTFSIPKDKYYDSLYIKNDVSIILNINETKNVISHIKLEKKKHYKNNEKVGTSYIYVGKKLVHKEDIYARKTNKKESIFKRIF